LWEALRALYIIKTIWTAEGPNMEQIAIGDSLEEAVAKLWLDKLSIRKFNFGVFTQPRPNAEVAASPALASGLYFVVVVGGRDWLLY